MRLYELSRAYEEALERNIDFETGEIRGAAAEQELADIEGKLEEKALNCAALTVDFEAEAEKIEKRAKELLERSKALYHRAEWLRGYLARHLSVGTKLADDRVALTIAPGSARVNEVIELAKLPEQYKSTEIRVHKADILRDLKAGVHIPGATLMWGPPSVRIR